MTTRVAGSTSANWGQACQTTAIGCWETNVVLSTRRSSLPCRRRERAGNAERKPRERVGRVSRIHAPPYSTNSRRRPGGLLLQDAEIVAGLRLERALYKARIRRLRRRRRVCSATRLAIYFTMARYIGVRAGDRGAKVGFHVDPASNCRKNNRSFVKHRGTTTTLSLIGAANGQLLAVFATCGLM